MSGAGNTAAPSTVNEKIELMQQAITDMGTTFKKFIECQGSNGHQTSNGNGQIVVEQGEGNEQLSLLRQFQNMNPPSFKGAPEPAMAETWVKKLEKVFKILKCTDQQKVQLAVYMLEGEVDDWWANIEEGFQKNGVQITWDLFVKTFYQRYFSEAVQEKKEQEFLNLKQGDMSVNEYQAKFNALSRFAPHIVSDEARKVRRFEKGLRSSIRNKMIPQRLKKSEDALATAQLIEQDLDEQKQEMEDQKGKGKAATNQPLDKRQDVRGKRKSFEGNNPNPFTCTRCGKNHVGRECYWKSGACFKCGKLDHIIKDCPDLKEQNQQPHDTENKRPRVQGRFYAITNPTTQSADPAMEDE